MPAEMTSRERVLAAINGKDFDVYPAINPTSIATIDMMTATGVCFPAAHTNPYDAAKLAASGHDILGYDSIMPYFSVHLEASALGCEMDWGTNLSMPVIVKKAIKSSEQFSMPSKLLACPELSGLLKTIRLLKSTCKSKVAIIGKVVGPWTLAYNIYGVENLIMDTILEPKRTKQFIHELVSLPIKFAKAQFEAGADIVTWADHVTSDLISPQIYEEFVLPIHKKAAFELSPHGIVVLHTCGNVMDRLSLFKKSGFKIFHIDSRNDIKRAVEIVGDELVLTGSINNPVTLAQGNLSDIRKEVEYNISSGIRLISPECAVPCNVSKENLKAIPECAHHIKGRL